MTEPLRIGSLELNSSVLLAPMAGVTDLAFRKICKEQGCGLAYTEMVSAKAIYYNNIKTEKLLASDEQEGQVGVQLFGSNPEIISEMAKRIDSPFIALFDVNMGCPVAKVVNNNEGSALMKDPKLISRIVKALVAAVDKPVTIKIRKGFDEAHVNAVEVAKIAEDAGACAITIHGRTRDQFYSGKADWEIIRAVKENLTIPVIGNGDVFTAKDAKAMIERTACDGIMIGRGCQGNPWIFNEINQYLKNGVFIPRPTTDEIIQMIIRHGQDLKDLKGEFTAVREMRKHISWYTKGLPHATRLRNLINGIDDYTELMETVKKTLNDPMV